jgi:hypothetical protein
MAWRRVVKNPHIPFVCGFFEKVVAFLHFHVVEWPRAMKNSFVLPTLTLLRGIP